MNEDANGLADVRAAIKLPWHCHVRGCLSRPPGPEAQFRSPLATPGDVLAVDLSRIARGGGAIQQRVAQGARAVAVRAEQ